MFNSPRQQPDGAGVMAEFEVVFSNLGKLDNGQRAQLDTVCDMLEPYMAIDDFELETTDTGFEVTIEGEIPVVDEPRADHAYFIAVSESASLPGYHRVALQTGDDFAAMGGEMSAISLFLRPHASHPKKCLVDGESNRLPARRRRGQSSIAALRRTPLGKGIASCTRRANDALCN